MSPSVGRKSCSYKPVERYSLLPSICKKPVSLYKTLFRMTSSHKTLEVREIVLYMRTSQIYFRHCNPK